MRTQFNPPFLCFSHLQYDGSMIAKLPQTDNSWIYMTLADLFYQVLLTKFHLDETEQVLTKSQQMEEINR